MIAGSHAALGTLTVTNKYTAAIQRMAAAGTLTGSPQDIGPLMREVGTKGKEEDIKDLVWSLFRRDIRRMVNF